MNSGSHGIRFPKLTATATLRLPTGATWRGDFPTREIDDNSGAAISVFLSHAKDRTPPARISQSLPRPPSPSPWGGGARRGNADRCMCCECCDRECCESPGGAFARASSSVYNGNNPNLLPVYVRVRLREKSRRPSQQAASLCCRISQHHRVTGDTAHSFTRACALTRAPDICICDRTRVNVSMRACVYTHDARGRYWRRGWFWQDRRYGERNVLTPR